MPNRPLVCVALASMLCLSACGPSDDTTEAERERGSAPDATTVDQPKVAHEPSAVATSEEPAERNKAGIEADRKDLTEGSDLAEQQGIALGQSTDDTSDPATEKAKELIEQAKAYIAEQQPALAQKAVNKLNVLKDVMSKAIQKQIEQLETALPEQQDFIDEQYDEARPAAGAQ